MSRAAHLTRLRQVIALIERAAAALITVVLAAMVVIVLSQFVDRYFTPVWGGVPADEYVKVGLVWLTFIGFGLAMRAGVEVRVELVDKYLPEHVRRIAYIFFDGLLLLMLGVILWKSIRLYQVGTLQTILGTDTTVAVPVLGMLFGFALMALALLARVLRRAVRVEI